MRMSVQIRPELPKSVQIRSSANPCESDQWRAMPDQTLRIRVHPSKSVHLWINSSVSVRSRPKRTRPSARTKRQNFSLVHHSTVFGQTSNNVIEIKSIMIFKNQKIKVMLGLGHLFVFTFFRLFVDTNVKCSCLRTKAEFWWGYFSQFMWPQVYFCLSS